MPSRYNQVEERELRYRLAQKVGHDMAEEVMHSDNGDTERVGQALPNETPTRSEPNRPGP